MTDRRSVKKKNYKTDFFYVKPPFSLYGYGLIFISLSTSIDP